MAKMFTLVSSTESFRRKRSFSEAKPAGNRGIREGRHSPNLKQDIWAIRQFFHNLTYLFSSSKYVISGLNSVPNLPLNWVNLDSARHDRSDQLDVHDLNERQGQEQEDVLERSWNFGKGRVGGQHQEWRNTFLMQSKSEKQGISNANCT